MQFKNGTGVFTSDGKQVGHVDRVVLDPGTKEVVAVVVRRGMLLPEDKVVDISLIESATDDRVVLYRSAGHLDDLPEYEETHYIPLDDETTKHPADYVPPLYWYPPVGSLSMGYLGGYAVPPYVVQTRQNIPEGTVALKAGARVISADGRHVGDVHEVLTDQYLDRATHIVISQGLLLKEHRLIPTTWIKDVTDEEIHLTVNADFINELRPYPVGV